FVMNGIFSATCLCGGIQLQYSGEIGPANYCHCEDCRKVTGSAFNVGVRVDRAGLELDATTELRCHRSTSARGSMMERWFCGACGSPIYTLHDHRPTEAWVKAGIINQPEIVQPVFEIWTCDKVPWSTVQVAESHERSRPSSAR